MKNSNLSAVAIIFGIGIIVVYFIKDANRRFNPESQIPSVAHTGKAMTSPRKASYKCGEECSYSTEGAQPGFRYPFIRKKFICDNIFYRWAYLNYTVTYPPPKRPPKDMYKEFTMNGDCPLGTDYYLINFSPGVNVPPVRHTLEAIQNLVNKVKQNKVISDYRNRNVEEAVKKWQHLVKNKHALVVGTLHPWVEAILIHFGVGRITTAEYNVPNLMHPIIKVVHPKKLAKEFISDRSHENFDVAVSYSSLEHSGLGRYGDPLNPYGDLEAMAQIWCMIKPDGHMLLNVPLDGRNNSLIQWNAHRIYGWKRLQHMTANWKVLDLFRDIYVLKKSSGL